MMLALSDFARCGAAACANMKGIRKFSATDRSHMSWVQSCNGADNITYLGASELPHDFGHPHCHLGHDITP